MVPVGVIVEELRFGQVAGCIPHVPTGRRVVDLAHQLVGQTRLTDTPLGDDGEDVRELFRLLIHQMNEVLELIEELRLADDRMCERIARYAAAAHLLFFLFHAHSVSRFRVARPSLMVLMVSSGHSLRHIVRQLASARRA